MDNETTKTTTEGEVKGTTQAETTVEAAVATEPKPEAQEGQDQTKVETPVTFTKVDHDKALEQAKASVKGGYEGTVKKLKDDLTRTQQAHEQLLAQIEQERQEAFLKTLETNGIDANVGRQLVERERKVNTQERQLRELAAQLGATQEELNRAAFAKKVSDLAKTYELSDEEAITLASAQNPIEMENLALKAAMTKAATKAKSPTKVAGDGSGKSNIDLSKLGDAEALGMAAEGKI